MISSTGNSRIKRIALFNEKSRERVKENVFIAEGIKMFEEAPEDKIREIYIDEKLLEDGRFKPFAEKIEKCRSRDILVETVTEEVFRKISDTMAPQGILCVMERFSYDSEMIVREALKRQEKEGHAPLFLLVEDVQDPGNLGTMLRTAEGAGADGVFLTGGCADIYNPKTIRATMGSLYRVPFCHVKELKEGIKLLRENGVTVYAAHLKGEKYYHEIDYRGGCAFLIGNEGKGLKKETADLADCYLKIPMEGKLESLNAAVAAALLMYQSRFYIKKG